MCALEDEAGDHEQDSIVERFSKADAVRLLHVHRAVVGQVGAQEGIDRAASEQD